MEFRIADTFTDSLARLTGDEQKAVKTSAFDLQLDPSGPGLSFHKLDRAKDRNFWSVRASADIRLIVHRTAGSLLLCYVDHHDRAYAWAERRKLQAHPKTGAAQLVEIRETVQEVVVPGSHTRPAPSPKATAKPLFAATSDEALLDYGVPAEWLADVRRATEETLLSLVEHLPGEAAEALLELATGGSPRVPARARAGDDPFLHPDALRRFRLMDGADELARALEYPWDKWSIFLHPEQRDWIGRDFAGPARVSGSAGTGKTIVALHRAAHLARAHPDARVLLTTLTETLAVALRTRLRRLLAAEPRLGERIDVDAIDAVGLRLYRALIGPAKLADRTDVADRIARAAAGVPGHKFSRAFLVAEWEHLVDAWQIGSWEAYRDVPRLGRKTRLVEAQRAVLWSILERVAAGLAADGLITPARLFTAVAAAIAGARNPPYEAAVVDEAQDLGVPHMRFLSALGGGRPNGLFLAGDVGQRIFQQPFSWKSLGVDVRGRSRTLRVNYRTSHQIRSQADRLLGPEMTDADGTAERRDDTVSVFNGPAPTLMRTATPEGEAAAVGAWLAGLVAAGIAPHEIGLFVRSPAQYDRAIAAARSAAIACRILDDHVDTVGGQMAVCTMPLAKGLEFRAVAVMACDDEVIPSQERIQAVGDDADLQEVYDTERQLLYVACTRARDHLLVSGVRPASEFLDDLTSGPGAGD